MLNLDVVLTIIIGYIKARTPYVWMRQAEAACGMRFMVRIRMRQTEYVNGRIQNVSAHESDKKFQGVTSLQTCFPN